MPTVIQMSHAELVDKFCEVVRKVKAAKVTGWSRVRAIRLPLRWDEGYDEGQYDSDLDKLPQEVRNRISRYDGECYFICGFYDGKKFSLMSSERVAFWLRWYAKGEIVKPTDRKAIWENSDYVPGAICPSCGSRWVFSGTLEPDYSRSGFMGCRMCRFSTLPHAEDDIEDEDIDNSVFFKGDRLKEEDIVVNIHGLGGGPVFGKDQWTPEVAAYWEEWHEQEKKSRIGDGGNDVRASGPGNHPRLTHAG